MVYVAKMYKQVGEMSCLHRCGRDLDRSTAHQSGKQRVPGTNPGGVAEHFSNLACYL